MSGAGSRNLRLGAWTARSAIFTTLCVCDFDNGLGWIKRRKESGFQRISASVLAVACFPVAVFARVTSRPAVAKAKPGSQVWPTYGQLWPLQTINGSGRYNYFLNTLDNSLSNEAASCELPLDDVDYVPRTHLWFSRIELHLVYAV